VAFFKNKGKGPAFSGNCGSPEAASWASGLAPGGDWNGTARAAEAYCAKQKKDRLAKKGAVPIAIDVEVLPEAAG